MRPRYPGVAPAKDDWVPPQPSSKPHPEPLSAEYFDRWYAVEAADTAVTEIMRRHLGFPPDLLVGVATADAIPEIMGTFQLRPGASLADLACGRVLRAADRGGHRCQAH